MFYVEFKENQFALELTDRVPFPLSLLTLLDRPLSLKIHSVNTTVKNSLLLKIHWLSYDIYAWKPVQDVFL